MREFVNGRFSGDYTVHKIVLIRSVSCVVTLPFFSFLMGGAAKPQIPLKCWIPGQNK